MTLPTSQRDLMAYFNKPLEESEKVPLSHYCMTTPLSRGEPTIMCNEGDLQRIFRASEDEEADYLWTILKMAIVTVRQMVTAPKHHSSRFGMITFEESSVPPSLQTRSLGTAIGTRVQDVRDPTLAS